MSDSETDLLPNNVFTFQGTTVSAKGPNINTNLSFRNNAMTSTMNMPWNMNRPRYAESVYDQRSMYYSQERETSPMSFHSASGMQPRNFHHSYYPGAMSSHRSMYNGRGVSPPMSIRTTDSNTSMSAKDIAFAFQNGTFNKFDFKIIKDAYNRYMKKQCRKRVEKRRNMRMFLKGFRRKSGGDSGDQASDSSISSDGCRSTKTSRSTIYKENIPSCRSTKTDIPDFRRTMRESDCSENFRQNTFKRMIPERENWQNLQQKSQNSSVVNSDTWLQNDRFRGGLPLPSQRFNKSIASLPIPEKSNGLQRMNEDNLLDIRSNVPDQISRDNKKTQDTDSDQEQIFSDVTVMEKPSVSFSRKRIREGDDISVPDEKRIKLALPKNNPQSKTSKQNQTTVFTKQKSGDFVFAKPQLPLKKPTITKQQKPVKATQAKAALLPKNKPVKPTEEMNMSKSVEQPVDKVISSSQKAIEKLFSKSSQPLEPDTEKTNTENNIQKLPQNITQEKEPLLTDTTQHSTTDMSMRPSFIKRKLFTQKIDVAEKNSSSDSLQADSPQTNVYSKIQKEKNRARRLVSTQSYLNREVGDDSNLLDLIHRIVPAEHMNVTSAANRTETQNNKSKPTKADKLDVTSLISTCNNSDDESVTFTDEEIFDGVKEQTRHKPPESKKKAANEVIKKTAVKENKNTNNKISNKQKDIKSKEQIMEKPSEIKKKVVNEIQLKPAITEKIDIDVPKSVVVIERLQPHNHKQPANTINEPNSPTKRLGLMTANIYKGVKSFWDTDAESDLEATPVKIGNSKNTEAPTSEIIADAPGKKVMGLVTKVNKTPNRKLPLTTQVINSTTNQQFNSSLLNKENIQTKKHNKNINKTADAIFAENKSVEKGLVKTKTKPAANVVKSKKTLLASKENKPQKDSSLPQKPTKNITSKAKSNINNNDSTVSNNESQHKNDHNKTLRIRTRKMMRCCVELDASQQSLTNNNTDLCRSLRSREIDLSTSLKSVNGCTTVTKKSPANNKRPKISEMFREKTLPSDVSFNSTSSTRTMRNKKTSDNSKEQKPRQCNVSFTLTTENSDVSFTLATDAPSSTRTMRNKKTSTNSKEQKLRQSNVSFTLTENKLINDTVYLRSSKRNRELESLRNNSASFFESGKRSLSRKI